MHNAHVKSLSIKMQLFAANVFIYGWLTNEKRFLYGTIMVGPNNGQNFKVMRLVEIASSESADVADVIVTVFLNNAFKFADFGSCNHNQYHSFP